jgi:hypothetical protein
MSKGLERARAGNPASLSKDSPLKELWVLAELSHLHPDGMKRQVERNPPQALKRPNRLVHERLTRTDPEISRGEVTRFRNVSSLQRGAWPIAPSP